METTSQLRFRKSKSIFFRFVGGVQWTHQYGPDQIPEEGIQTHLNDGQLETPDPESEHSESGEEEDGTDQLWQNPSSNDPVILCANIDEHCDEGQPNSRSSRRKARQSYFYL